MKYTKYQQGIIKGLGILLMVIGINMVDNWMTITTQSMIGICISIIGWLIYPLNINLS